MSPTRLLHSASKLLGSQHLLHTAVNNNVSSHLPNGVVGEGEGGVLKPLDVALLVATAFGETWVTEYSIA